MAATNERWLIDGVDFTDCIKAGGLKWKKIDLESDKAGRTLDGVMHRSIIAKKRQLTISCRRLNETRMRQLASALDKESVSITHPDVIAGSVTKTYYGTEIESVIWGRLNGVLYWDAATFTLTEV